MAVASQIRSLLITRINNLATVQAVYGYEETHPSGYPAVFVVPANMDGEFVTTNENRRVYSFSIRVIYPTGQNLPKDASKTPVEYAEDTINDVIDDIINDVDKNYELDGTTVLFVSAADCVWGFVDYEGGQVATCDITYNIHTDFDVTT